MRPDGRADAEIDREHRIELLAQAFDALLAGRIPSAEACAFLGGAGESWLADGGSLERDHLRVRAPSGSHRQPHVVAREIRPSSSRKDDKVFVASQTRTGRLHQPS